MVTPVRTLLIALCALVLGAALAPTSASATPAGKGVVHLVQAVPGEDVDVSIDGRTVEKDVAVKAVLGPYDLSAGEHKVAFSGDGMNMTATVKVVAGSNSDVVLHRPASASGDPVVNVYRTPASPIGPDKARVLLAHTALVPPADVEVDDQVVFTNIANGEFAKADVPAGTHAVALLPTGQKTNPILGPIDVALKARTVTMVYAFGSPEDGSMDVIAHTEALKADGTVVPHKIDTGSAGLASDVTVRPYGAESSLTEASAVSGAQLAVLLGIAGAGLLGAGALSLRRGRSGGAHRAR